MVPDRKNWVIIGCGYAGTHLARRLVADGRAVTATRRSATAAQALADELGVTGAVVDLSEVSTLEGLIPAGAVVVDSVPPADGEVAGERDLVAAASAAGAARIVYLSSTGVYPPSADGAWIDEDVEPAPAGPRGAARLAAETALLDAARDAGVEAVALRIAGIYGPGRGVPARLRAGTYRIVGEGNTFVCRIHVDDIASAVIAAGTADPLPGRVFNVCDDEPAPSSEVADETARMLGVAAPPRVPLDQVSPDVATMLTANRRVSNRRLREVLGVTLRYPTWREGFPQAIEEDSFRSVHAQGR